MLIRPVTATILLLGLVAGLVNACTAKPLASRPEGLAFSAVPILLAPASWKTAENADLLTLTHAVRLTSDQPRFGGWSGLSARQIDADGTAEMTAVSDRGYWLRFRVSADGQTLDAPLFGPLTDLAGGPLTANIRRDAEEVIALPDGQTLVVFERDHRLWLYPAPHADTPPFGAPPENIPLPPDLASVVDHNGGIEAMTLLPDGRLVIIAEGDHHDDDTALWVTGSGSWLTSPDWRRFNLPTDRGLHPTAVTATDDGRLVLLERNFSFFTGFGTRLRSLPTEALTEGAKMRLPAADVIASFGPTPISENFEGLASLPDPAGGTTLFLISDNNYTSLQSTIFLRLTLSPRSEM